MKKIYLILFLMASFSFMGHAYNGVDFLNKKKVRIDIGHQMPTTRSPQPFDVSVQSEDNILSITFYGTVPNANITITDNSGQIVEQQTSTTISNGMTISVTPDDDYPYTLSITSSSINIIGVISLE